MSKLVFPNVKSVAELEGAELAAALRDLGDEEALSELQEPEARGLFGARRPAWKNTTARIGFVQAATDGRHTIVPASSIEADADIQGQQVDVRLDRFRVLSYPGSGRHEVMVTFQAAHQHGNADAEPITFSQAYDVQEGQGAGVSGYPIFRGLAVGAGGLDFRLATVTVKNSGDEAILKILGSDALTQGLGLLTTAQPALKPFVEVGRGLAETIASRNRNRKVSEAYLGLDFHGDAVTGIRLAYGTYVLTHSDDALRWDDWVYDAAQEAIVRAKGEDLLPYNYMLFRIAPHG